MWRSIVLNNGVLIIADSAEIASGSVIAALSLFEPLYYEEPKLLYTNENDPRYQELLMPNSKYKIVGTTDKTLADKQRSFSTVINIQTKDFQDMSELNKMYVKKTHRFVCIIMSRISYNLLIDPYFNILNKTIDTEVFYKKFSEFPKELFEKFQNSLTFQKWRYRKINIDQIRTSFLSVTPEEAASHVKDSELKLAYNELKRIVHLCQNDIHLRLVLEKNIRILKRKLNAITNH